MNRMYTDKKEDGFKTGIFDGQLHPQERFFVLHLCTSCSSVVEISSESDATCSLFSLA
jgi:hypothetical protein